MIKSQSIETIEQATGRSWTEWLVWFKEHGAETMSHSEIADLVYSELKGKVESAGWWSQSVTVAYEQSTGQREPGQRNDGSFEISVSKTVLGERKKVFEKYAKELSRISKFGGKKIENVRISVTPKRNYWKCDLPGHGKVEWSFEEKTLGKVLVTVMHSQLASSEDAAGWRSFWKNYLAQ